MHAVSAADPRRLPPAGSLWWPERMIRRGYIVLVTALSLGVLANEVYTYGLDIAEWDWLLVTGFASLLAAGYFALVLPDEVTDCVNRLVDRRVLTGSDPVAFLDGVHQLARRNGLIAAPVVVGLLVVAFVTAYGNRLGRAGVLLGVEAVGAVAVGLFIGRALTYGRLGRRLAEAGFTVRPDPDHLDGVAGLRPIGDLYFHQAGLLAVPGLYLAVWWIVIPVLGERYAAWRTPYVGLLAVIVVAELLAFLLPMIWFHRLMAHRRSELHREADALSARHAGDPGAATDSALTARYAAIEGMPTWPVDGRVRRRFGLGNVVLVLPVLAQVLGASQGLQEALGALGRVLSGAS